MAGVTSRTIEVTVIGMEETAAGQPPEAGGSDLCSPPSALPTSVNVSTPMPLKTGALLLSKKTFNMSNCTCLVYAIQVHSNIFCDWHPAYLIFQNYSYQNIFQVLGYLKCIYFFNNQLYNSVMNNKKMLV